MRSNREIVQAALANHAPALVFASADLKNDKEFMLAAMRTNEHALRYAGPELLLDPTFAPVEKCQVHILKFTLLSGQSFVHAPY
eukprot:2999033-Amphidinium_carterae.1